MRLKFSSSILFCHSTPTGDGTDDINALKTVLDPRKTLDDVTMTDSGTSTKKSRHKF